MNYRLLVLILYSRDWEGMSLFPCMTPILITASPSRNLSSALTIAV